MEGNDPFGAIKEIDIEGEKYKIADLNVLEQKGICKLDQLPYSIRILLESVLRNTDGNEITKKDIKNTASWKPNVPDTQLPFKPSRIVLQDLTGVPAVVDLAALRSEAKRKGHDPKIIEPDIPIDLVIDHSVQVDYYGSNQAFERNVEMEYERNAERYKALKWAQNAFEDFQVVPPGTGIVHQVNLEYLGRVVHNRTHNQQNWLYPDTLLGTDSHTPMIGGIGVVGWGVGGIEAEAAMLGQPVTIKLPEIIGVKLTGQLPKGATATDLVLHITEKLRQENVVDKFVEFYGPGLKTLTVPDRATIANMAPEQGSTISIFPPDQKTLDYLQLTGRKQKHINKVKKYLKHQGLYGPQNPQYTKTIQINLNTIEPSLSGHKKPHNRIPMQNLKTHFDDLLNDELNGELNNGNKEEEYSKKVPVEVNGEKTNIGHGSIVVSAITSCTNTSNPSVMLGAGMLAKNAVEKGLDVPPYVKTSLAPGSRVVTEYLKASELLPYLEELGYHIVGYGCTTCIGNSGPLPETIENAIEEHNLWTASILSGNRNFEARIHPKIRANYLASPPLVVAYGIAGRIDINLQEEPLGKDKNGNEIYLKDIWPNADEIHTAIHEKVDPSMFKEKYANVFEGDERWKQLQAPTGNVYEWDKNSTYIREPPFFKNLPIEKPGVNNIQNARCLMLLGNTVTTDHISPAGPFSSDLPAGQWLIEQGVDPKDFNTYGARRGNHEVMMRGTFANVRIKNKMLEQNIEGGYTIHHPTDEQTTIFDASQKYKENDTPLIVCAGEEFGTGSSRDWAAKGTDLLGIKATIAKSYERIYRDNLIGMGVLPLKFKENDSWQSLNLDGTEKYTIKGLQNQLKPNQELTVTAEKNGKQKTFPVTLQATTPADIKCLQHGGILHYALRQKLKKHQQ